MQQMNAQPNPPVAVPDSMRQLFGQQIPQWWNLWHIININDKTENTWANFPADLTFFNLSSDGDRDERTNLDQAGEVPWPFLALQFSIFYKMPMYSPEAAADFPPQQYALIADLFSWYARFQLKYQQSDIIDLINLMAPGGVGIVSPVAVAASNQAAPLQIMGENLHNGTPMLGNRYSFGMQGVVLAEGKALKGQMFLNPARVAAIQAYNDQVAMGDIAIGICLSGYRGKMPQ